MIWNFIAYEFAGLWALAWHFGIGIGVIAVCAALYVFEPAFLTALFPRIQKILIAIIVLTITIMISTAIGVSLGEKRIQAQWDTAKANTLESAKKARANAVRDVARKPSKWVRHNRVDPDQRD